MNKTHKIQWLNLPGYKGETWNPILGCQKVSDGCKNCYAEKMAFRIAHMEISAKRELHYSKVIGNGTNRGWNGNTHFVADAIEKPLEWKQPRVIFVCSMGDLFFEKHSFQDIDKVFAVMASCPQHIFIVLTKRAARMQEYYNWKDTYWKNEGMQGNERIRYYAWHKHGVKIEFENWKWPLPNVWVGVSAENQEAANERLPYLIEIPSPVKFVSIEPMLGTIDLTKIRTVVYVKETNFLGFKYLTGKKFEGPKIDWVICGGESGYNARPVHPDWVRSLRDQCKSAGVPFFFKQWGEWIPVTEISTMLWGHPADWKGKHSWVNQIDGKDTHEGAGCQTVKVGRHAAGNLLDGVKYEEYPKINL